jgi:hypothetical protein
MSLTAPSEWPLLRSHNKAILLVETSAEPRRRSLDSIRGELRPLDDGLMKAGPRHRARRPSSVRDTWRIRGQV